MDMKDLADTFLYVKTKKPVSIDLDFILYYI